MPFAEKKAAPYVFIWKGPLCLFQLWQGCAFYQQNNLCPSPILAPRAGSHSLWAHVNTHCLDADSELRRLLLNSSRCVFHTAGLSLATSKQPCFWRKPLSSLPAPDHRSCPEVAPFLLWAEANLQGTWLRELDHIVVDLAHSRAFSIHFSQTTELSALVPQEPPGIKEYGESLQIC